MALGLPSPAERQAIIDHSARVDRQSFMISGGVLLGIALLCVVVRFAIRFHRNVSLRWDDVLVLLAAICLSAGFSVAIRVSRPLYLVEAINKGLVFPNPKEFLEAFGVLKWATIFAAMNWTAVYLVKFAFFCFFHVLIQDMPRRITRFYWISVTLTIMCWIYTVLSPVIVCHHFGADAIKCRTDPNFYKRSLSNNLLVNCIDIITDFFIICLPLIVVKQAIMPLSRKISLASMLCLSVVMVVCAIVRLIFTITDTEKDGNGTAPVFAIYWSLVEGCVALMMTSVIAIRGVFVNSRTRESDGRSSTFSRIGRRLLSPLRFFGYSPSANSSPPHSNKREKTSGAPRLPSQALTRVTLTGVTRFIGGRHHRGESQDDVLKSIDTTYMLENLDYHDYQRQQASRSGPSVP